MKIIELNPFYLPYNGGIERRIAAFSSRFSGKHSIHVVTSRLPGTAEEEDILGARVIRLPSRYYGSYNPPIVTSSGVDEAIESIDPDIVDYHYRWSGSYNRAFFRSDRRRVMTFHNLYAEGTGAVKVLSSINDWIFVRRMRSIDHVLSVSNFVREQLVGRGISQEKVSTSYNGVELYNGRTTDERFALFLGRLVPTKGLRQLARAALESGVPLKIAGTGPLMDYLKRFEKLGSIELLGGVTEQEKDALLSSCTFVVLPSLQEAFGVVALEAMSHSKPVIASDSGGLPEVVGDGGSIVGSGDIGALASAMKDYWEDGELAALKGSKARQQAEKFSWDRTTADMESVYKSVLTSGDASA